MNKIDILILTHGNLGRELVETAYMFVSFDPHLKYLGIDEDDHVQGYLKRINNMIRDSENLLILTDILSGITTQVALLVSKNRNVEIISGVNLMMLITALREKEKYDLSTLVQCVDTSAREDIVNIKKKIK